MRRDQVCILQQEDVRVNILLSTRLSLVLIAPCWPQKDWFADLFALLVAEPIELPVLWNLLCTFTPGNYESNLSERLFFHKELCRSSLLTSRALHQLSIR